MNPFVTRLNFLPYSPSVKVEIPAEGFFARMRRGKINAEQQYFFNNQKNEHDIMLIKLYKRAPADIPFIELPTMVAAPQEAASEDHSEEANSEEANSEEATSEEGQEVEKRSTSPLKKHCSSPAHDQMVNIGGWGQKKGEE